MTKEELLLELSLQTYVRLKPSSLHGISVFAIRDIPKGCRNILSRGMEEWIKVPIQEVDALPDHSHASIETYCLFDEFDYFVPDYGFGKLLKPFP